MYKSPTYRKENRHLTHLWRVFGTNKESSLCKVIPIDNCLISKAKLETSIPLSSDQQSNISLGMIYAALTSRREIIPQGKYTQPEHHQLWE
jgi:hypothetical protein